jgi:hypothetical protein
MTDARFCGVNREPIMALKENLLLRRGQVSMQIAAFARASRFDRFKFTQGHPG